MIFFDDLDTSSLLYMPQWRILHVVEFCYAYSVFRETLNHGNLFHYIDYCWI